MSDLTKPKWLCPQCGRAFSRRNQSHYCGPAPETIDAYIAAQPEQARPYLAALRDTIRAALPDVQERISWSMPTYWDGCNIIQFAAAKAHIGLFPGSEAVEHFSEQLTGFQFSRGTIKLPYNKPLPLELVTEIAKWCYAESKGP